MQWGLAHLALLICGGIGVATPTFAAPLAKPTPQVESLTLVQALEKGNQKNPTLTLAKLALELEELTYDNARDRFFVPSITLGSTAGSNYSLFQLPHSTASGAWPSDASNNREHGAPTSSAGLSLGSYTLFNFGKDKDAYESAKMRVERQKQVIIEVRRAVRFQITQLFFEYKTNQDLLDLMQRSVDQADAIVALIKSRVPLKRATESDLSSAEVDMLNAKNLLISQQITFQQASWALSQALGDPINTQYNVKGEIKYHKFKQEADDIIRLYKQYAPTLRDSRLAHEQAKIALRLAQKNRLPLPTVAFSGVTFGYDMNQNGTTHTRTTTNSNASGNFNVSASLNFTMPLYGEGGFLGSRTLRAAQIALEQAELNLRTSANNVDIQARNLYNQILQAEATIANTENLFSEAAVVFDNALKLLNTNPHTNRLDFKNAIEQIRSAEQALTSSILNHYKLKLQLAQLVGVDRLDGEDL